MHFNAKACVYLENRTGSGEWTSLPEVLHRSYKALLSKPEMVKNESKGHRSCKGFALIMGNESLLNRRSRCLSITA